jgi:hypothetical protein
MGAFALDVEVLADLHADWLEIQEETAANEYLEMMARDDQEMVNVALEVAA